MKYIHLNLESTLYTLTLMAYIHTHTFAVYSLYRGALHFLIVSLCNIYTNLFVVEMTINLTWLDLTWLDLTKVLKH